MSDYEALGDYGMEGPSEAEQMEKELVRLRAERQKWKEERELWRGLVWLERIHAELWRELVRDAMDALESDDLEPRRRMFERLQDVFGPGGAG